MNTRDWLYYSTHETTASKISTYVMTLSKQNEKNKQTNNNLCAFCLTFSFQASYGVQLSSRSVRKRYVFHVPSRTLDGKLKLSISEVPQSLKVTKTSMDQTKTGLHGAQAYGAERLTRDLSVTLTCPLLA